MAVRKFEGVWIPKEIWLSTELSLQEKAFIVEIKSLDNEHGCFANNRYFSEFFQISLSRVSQIIKELESKNLVTTDYIYRDGSREIERRIIRINQEELCKITGLGTPLENYSPPLENYSPPLEKAVDNSTINNTSYNNTSKDVYHSPTPIIPTKTRQQKKVTDIQTIRGMIGAYTDNMELRNKLLDYFTIRLKKGLTPQQWQVILEDLKSFCGDNIPMQVEKLNNAISGGYMQIIASWEKDKKSQPKKPGFDNTAGRQSKAFVNLTPQEKADFAKNLPKDKDGKPVQF